MRSWFTSHSVDSKRPKTWIKSHPAHDSCGFCKQSGDSHIKSPFYWHWGGWQDLLEKPNWLNNKETPGAPFWDYQHSAGSVCPSGLTKPGAGPKPWPSTLSGLRTGTGKSHFLGMTDFPAFGLQQGGCRHSLDWMLPTGKGMRSRAYRKRKNHRRNSNFPESHK